MDITSQAKPEVYLTGLYFPESPRWREDRLRVADWGSQTVITLGPAGREEMSFPSVGAIDHLPDGRMLMVSPADCALVRLDSEGSLAQHADLSAFGQHAWNDIVVDGRGHAYVNNLGFDFPDGEFAPGTIVVVGAEGSVRLVANGLDFPNGMAVTPDNSTLIVAESYGQRLTSFEIQPDGGLSNRRAWAEVDGRPDGICLDAEGAVWYADVASRSCVRVAKGGEVLDVIALDQGCFACALGGPERRTLFIVTNHWGDDSGESPSGRLVSVTVAGPGAGWP